MILMYRMVCEVFSPNSPKRAFFPFFELLFPHSTSPLLHLFWAIPLGHSLKWIMYEREGESLNLCGPSVCVSVYLAVRPPLPLSLVVCSFFLLNYFSTLCLTVEFINCGRGPVKFECSNPSDFRIEESGVVHATRDLQLPGLTALSIKASDIGTERQWTAQVRVSSKSSQQVKTNLTWTINTSQNY